MTDLAEAMNHAALIRRQQSDVTPDERRILKLDDEVERLSNLLAEQDAT